MIRYTNDIKIDPNEYALVSYAKRFPIEIIDELARTDSSNEKIEILVNALTQNLALKTGLELCYSPRVKFGIKQIPVWKPATASAFHCERILKDLQLFVNREVTGNAAVSKLKDILEIAEPQDALFIERIISRDMKCGINSGLINKASKRALGFELIPEFPVMLCSAFDSSKISEWPFPCFVQTKMDGMRIAAIVTPNNITYHTRNGNSFDDDPTSVTSFIRSYIQHSVLFNNSFGLKLDWSSFALDGEMVVMSLDLKSIAPRKEGNGVLTRLIRGTSTPEDRKRLRFIVWDIIPLEQFNSGEWKMPYNSRYQLLSELISFALDNADCIEETCPVRVVKTSFVYNLDSAMKIYNEELESGNEGVIIKSNTGHWKSSRVKWQMKLKAEIEMDAKIVSCIEGTGKYEGMLGSFVCEATDERGVIRFNVGTGFTDKDRVDFWINKPLDKIVNVRYNEIITSSDGTRSLFLPVFVEVRNDVGPF